MSFSDEHDECEHRNENCFSSSTDLDLQGAVKTFSKAVHFRGSPVKWKTYPRRSLFRHIRRRLEASLGAFLFPDFFFFFFFFVRGQPRSQGFSLLVRGKALGTPAPHERGKALGTRLVWGGRVGWKISGILVGLKIANGDFFVVRLSLVSFFGVEDFWQGLFFVLFSVENNGLF